ncbi:Part of AAA domain-containing protein [Microbispora rosea]|uniref:Part of AAA domain-containing protein n=1 Tax=Microbispora rosea TaxID=58117 RepID=A0A1N7GDR0_9ACTN|nr:DUF3320 domain-containing protein [Microbispora rosea]SIS10713.1 Part of AAA domain-containing protein [Microbispora rosea]
MAMMQNPDNRLNAVVRSWRDSLIDLSSKNRLLNFKHTRSATLEIASPDTASLLGGLTKGIWFADIEALDEVDDQDSPRAIAAARPGEIFTQKTTQKSLDAALLRLFRDSNRVFSDTGLWVLQLGVGFLDWSEDGGTTLSSAPLLLVPVVLERKNDRFRLLAAEGEEAIPNPALAVKAEQFGIELSYGEQTENLPATLAAVQRAVAGMRSWSVKERVVLAIFQSHKEAMYRDLLDNEPQIMANPLVHAIGLGPQASRDLSDLDFTPVGLDELDRVQPPEDIPLVLDADSSQRQCLAAALQGRSFVMDGPPGTGKSQTIANMIAALLHMGRTVLFVSEKAAALDVVRNRLEHVGLMSFLMPLHSHNTSRKHVAQELGRALTEQPRARVPAPARDEARALRLELSAYAEGMNEVRQPLERSLFQVIGRLSDLDNVISLAPGPRYKIKDITAAHLREILNAAGTVSRAWRVASERESFLWWGLDTAESPRPYLDRVAEETDLLQRAIRRHEDLALPLGLDDLKSVERLTALLDLTACRPTVPARWLSEGDLTPLIDELRKFQVRRDRLVSAERAAEHEIGPLWHRLSPSLVADIPTEESQLLARRVRGVDVSGLTAEQAQTVAQRFTETAAMLRRHHTSLADIAALYGVPAPDGVDEAANLCELAAFSAADPKPQAEWLDSRSRHAARNAARELKTALNELDQARARARDLFSEKILSSPDLLGIAQRFAENHHGLSKLSSAYRRDKKLLLALAVTDKWNKTIAERLPEAVAWRQKDERFQALERQYSGHLGAFWAGEKTNFDDIQKALTAAERIDALAGDVRNIDLLAEQVTRGGTPNSRAYETAMTIRQDLTQWRASLVPAPHVGGRPALGQAALHEAAEWYEAHLPVLQTAIDLVQAVDAVSHRSPLTLGQARHGISLVQEARRERVAFETYQDADRALLGPLYQAESTLQSDIDDALHWISKVREIVSTGMPVETAERLIESSPDPDLAVRREVRREAVMRLAALWDKGRREEIRSGLHASFAEAHELISRLKADGSGPEEWRAYKQAHDVLAKHRLDDLIDRAVSQGVQGDQFVQLVERSVLQAWVEHHLASDPRLSTSIATQRDALVAEFRRVDKQLIEGAYAQVIEACNARRPSTTLGPAAIIRREAEKKTRHMPVRKLLADAAETVHRIKPCFMMSPLTVSQFLPADFTFDVVIFDEASQVRPHDAINCVYRGRSLIVAGDQKQMPPTNFFGTSDAEDDEYDEEVPDSFESLLDLCKASGVIRSLPLRWHYRSRHEALIAFSNHEFYEGGLVTFPGAYESGPDVGIRFHKVNGVYRRGSGRDNPIEAETVAKLVISHYSAYPSRSLGVVAMSGPQARAIEEAVERARESRPDLDSFFSEDRLDGFFVKNLETVQGDERDVIILSVGYGPDQHGKLNMNFGPLNRTDGWRRLNVAVTRARYRVDVVASFTAGTIPDSDNVSRQHFKRYLEYAERGPAVLARQVVVEEAGYESEFEESVATVLRDWGYDVVPQVGVAGYRIDLGIRHPDEPGRYAVGIECDGPMYHSSRVARDRDRLRDQVLQGLGWELHRIWGAHWYRNRPESEQRLRSAIEAAVEKGRNLIAARDAERTDGVTEETPKPLDVPRVEMEAVEEIAKRSWSTPYRKAQIWLVPDALPEMHLPEARTQIRHVFLQILDVESPIHRDQLFLRTRDAWGVGRLGGRIQANLEYVLSKMEGRREVALVEDFVFRSGCKVLARSPGDGIERKVGHIAPVEREAAILGIVSESPGIREAELLTEVSRFFGWRRSGNDISMVLREDLVRLRAQGRLSGLNGIVLTGELSS